MSLAAWAESGGASSEERALSQWADSQDRDRASIALARLAALPPFPKKPWRVLVPFPYEDREKLYKHEFDAHFIHARIEAAADHIVDFPLEWVVAIQHSVEPARVVEYILNPQLMEAGARHPKHGGRIDYPIVLRVHGVNACYDGHHRLTAAYLLGDRTIPVRLVDLEDEGEAST